MNGQTFDFHDRFQVWSSKRFVSSSDLFDVEWSGKWISLKFVKTRDEDEDSKDNEEHKNEPGNADEKKEGNREKETDVKELGEDMTKTETKNATENAMKKATENMKENAKIPL